MLATNCVGDKLKIFWQMTVDLVTNIQKRSPTLSRPNHNITNTLTEIFYGDVDGRPQFLKIKDLDQHPQETVTNIFCREHPSPTPN